MSSTRIDGQNDNSEHQKLALVQDRFKAQRRVSERKVLSKSSHERRTESISSNIDKNQIKHMISSPQKDLESHKLKQLQDSSGKLNSLVLNHLPKDKILLPAQTQGGISAKQGNSKNINIIKMDSKVNKQLQKSLQFKNQDGPSSANHLNENHRQSRNKSLLKSNSSTGIMLAVPLNGIGLARKMSSESDNGDEAQSVNSRRILDKNQRKSKIAALLPQELRNIMDEYNQNDEDYMYKNESSLVKKIENNINVEEIDQFDSNSDLDNERELLSQHNPDTLLSSKRQLINELKGNTKQRKDSDQSTLMRLQSSKKELVTPKKEPSINPQNSSKRKSRVLQQPTLGSEKSHYIKQQMKKLVKSYLNRSQTQQNEGDTKSPTNEQEKKGISTHNSKIKSTTKDESNIRYSYFKLDNKTDTPILEESFSEDQEKLNQQKKFRFLIRVNGKYRIRWDLFVMILSIWNCYSLPFDVAFQAQAFQTTFFEFLNNFIDICFGLDIIFNFRTTFLNRQTGDEVSSSKVIALEYLKTKFWVDLLATIPLDLMFDSQLENTQTKKLQLFSMLKLLRVLRLSKIITYMNATDEIKLSLKLFKMLFFLIMYLHCQACAWFYITSLDQLWVPPVNLAYNNFGFFHDDVTSQYLMSLYSSLLILYGGDMSPRGNTQLAFLCLAYVIAALINANILGTIAVIIQTLNRRASRFQEQIDIANTAMKNMKLPEELQRKVQDFMMYTQSNLDYQKQLDMFLNMISPSLRLQVTQHIFLNAISKNKIFRGNTELIRFVVHNIITLLYLPEDVIIRQDTKAHHIFFLAQGTCEVWVRDQFRRETFVRNLLQGMLFGEVALIAQVKRSASVKSKNYCTLAALNDENFYEICHQFPDIFFKMKQETQNYNDKWKTFQKKVISSIEYFSNLSEDLKEELHYKLSLEYFEKDTEIFTSGDICDALYFVVDGEIDLVIQQQNDEEVLLDTLYTGCSIGAYSLIQQQKYPYTARARNNVTILVLSRQDLYEAVDIVEELHYALWDAEEFINNHGVPLCDYTIYKALWRKSNEQPKPLQKFQNAVRRIRILNQRNKYKQIKFLDIIDRLRANYLKNKYGDHSNKRASATLINNNVRSHHSLAPFIQKHLVNQIKNKTADPGFRHGFDHKNTMKPKVREQAFVSKLTFKIENLSDHIKKQNKQMLMMQRLFNKKLNNILESQKSSKAPSSYSSNLKTDDEYGSDRYGSDRSRKKVKYQKNHSGFRTQAQNTQKESFGVQLSKPVQSREKLLLPVRNQTTKHKKKFYMQQPLDKLQKEKDKLKSLQLESLNKQSYFSKHEKKKTFHTQYNDISDQHDQSIALELPTAQKNGSQKSSRAGSALSVKSGKASLRYRMYDEDYAAGEMWEETGATNMNFNHQDSQETRRSGIIQKAKVIQNFSQLTQETQPITRSTFETQQQLTQQIQNTTQQVNFSNKEESKTQENQNRKESLLDYKQLQLVQQQKSALNSPNLEQLKLNDGNDNVSKKLSERRMSYSNQKDVASLSTFSKLHMDKHNRKQSDPYVKINMDAMYQKQQYRQQILNKLRGISSSQNSNNNSNKKQNNTSTNIEQLNVQKNLQFQQYSTVKKPDESRSNSNNSQNSSRRRPSQQQLYEEYRKELEIEKRIQEQIGRILEHNKHPSNLSIDNNSQQNNNNNANSRQVVDNLKSQQNSLNNNNNDNGQKKLSTQELIIQKMTQPNIYQQTQQALQQIPLQLPTIQPILAKNKSSLKEENAEKTQGSEIKKKVQIQHPPEGSYSQQLQKIFDAQAKEKSNQKSQQQMQQQKSHQSSQLNSNEKRNSNNNQHTSQKSTNRDIIKNQQQKDKKYEKMTTKDVNQLIEEEVNKMNEKNKKSNPTSSAASRKQTIREKNKKIDELLEKHFQEDIDFQDKDYDYYDENDELEQRLENIIEEEDIDYEYYYDEV